MESTFDYPGLLVLRLFFEDPYGELHLREVASRAGVSASTAKRFLDEYRKYGLLSETRKANLHIFRANLDEPAFRLWKTSWLLVKARQHLRGLAEDYPDSSLTLFGSCATGTDGPGSDLDLLLITRKPGDPSERVLRGFSKTVQRRVQVLKFTPEQWEKKAREDRPFYERVMIDGIPVSGSHPVVSP